MKAWNDIRAAALDQIRQKSFTGAMTQTGTKSLSRAGLESALKEIGPHKFSVLFSPKEQNFIKKLAAVAALKEPPPGTFTGSGPSSPAIKQLESTVSSVAKNVPVIGELLIDTLDSIKNRASDKKVLELTNDLIDLQREQAAQAFKAFRSSKAGVAASALPAAATASTSQNTNE
jgi:hypothetical protein